MKIYDLTYNCIDTKEKILKSLQSVIEKIKNFQEDADELDLQDDITIVTLTDVTDFFRVKA